MPAFGYKQCGETDGGWGSISLTQLRETENPAESNRIELSAEAWKTLEPNWLVVEEPYRHQDSLGQPTSAQAPLVGAGWETHGP